LPIRDILSPFPFVSAQNTVQSTSPPTFCVARLVVRHHALRRREDRHAEAVVDPRHVLDRGVDAPARLRDTLDLADHRLAVEILQLDLELAAARRARRLE
jgi:hypothetical protein